MKKRIDIIILAIELVILVILSMFVVYSITKNKNIDFNTKEVFTSNGDEVIVSMVQKRQEEYNTYLEANNTRIAKYDAETFKEALSQVKSKDYLAMQEYVAYETEDMNESEIKVFKEDMEVVLSNILLSMNIEVYEMGEDSTLANQRADYYDGLSNIEVLYEAIKYEQNIEDIVVYDTTMSKNLIQDNNLVGKILRVSIVVILILIVLAIYLYKVKNKQVVGIVILIVVIVGVNIGYKKLEENYHPLYMAVNDLFGVSVDTDLMYYLDFKPILVREEFELRGGVLPTEEEMSNPEALKNWYYSTPVGGFNILYENGHETGEVTTKVNNGDMLGDIVGDIENEAPEKENPYHPGTGGYGV